MTRSERRIAEHVANFDSPDEGVSRRAERFLIRYYAGRATSALIQACKHPNPAVRVRAAWTLGQSKDSAAFGAIFALTDDEDEGVRYDAVLALGKLGDERAIEPLCRMAQVDDPSRAAWNALAEFGTTIIPFAEESYRSPDVWVRSGGLFLAAQICLKALDERSVSVIRLARGDADEGIRADAESWVEELGLGI